MTTNTQRTDAFRASIEADLHAEWDDYTNSAWAGFAGALERERDEARKHLRDANRGAQVNARINQSMAGKLNEAAKQLEAMREAVVQLRDSLEVGKDSVETWDWCNSALAKLQNPPELIEA